MNNLGNKLWQWEMYRDVYKYVHLANSYLCTPIGASSV